MELSMKEMSAISGGEMTATRIRVLRNLIRMSKAIGFSTADQLFTKYGYSLSPEEMDYVINNWDSVTL